MYSFLRQIALKFKGVILRPYELYLHRFHMISLKLFWQASLLNLTKELTVPTFYLTSANPGDRAPQLIRARCAALE